MNCPRCNRPMYPTSQDYRDGRGIQMRCGGCGWVDTTRNASPEERARIAREQDEATARGREEYARSQGATSWDALVAERGKS